MSAEELQQKAALRTARRQTLTAAGIALGGNIAGGLISYQIAGWDAGDSFRAAHALVAAGVLIFLVRRRAASMRAVIACFLVLIVPVLPLLVVWTLAVPESRVLEPFIAQKIVLVSVALLAPESALIGLAVTAVVVIEAVALSALRLAGGRAGEPWVTLFYGLFAVAFLLHRASERRLAMRLIRMSAEASALERIAEESLDVRDRLNSPLQTLAIGLELLRRRAVKPEDAALIARLRATVDRLTELSNRLAQSARPDERDPPP
jgi:hypothetical protein